MIHELPSTEQARREPFLQVPLHVINDPTVSAQAKGVLIYCLSKPPDWRFNVREIASHFTNGVEAICTAINELIERGYADRRRRRSPKGCFGGFDYAFYAVPARAPSGKPVSGKAVSGVTGHGEAISGEPVYGDSRNGAEPPIKAEVQAQTPDPATVSGKPIYGETVSGKTVSGSQARLSYMEGTQIPVPAALSKNGADSDPRAPARTRAHEKVLALIGPEGLGVEWELAEEIVAALSPAEVTARFAWAREEADNPRAFFIWGWRNRATRAVPRKYLEANGAAIEPAPEPPAEAPLPKRYRIVTDEEYEATLKPKPRTPEQLERIAQAKRDVEEFKRRNAVTPEQEEQERHDRRKRNWGLFDYRDVGKTKEQWDREEIEVQEHLRRMRERDQALAREKATSVAGV